MDGPRRTKAGEVRLPTTETETVPPQREGDGEKGSRPAGAEERRLGDGGSDLACGR
uniref:Uncharacterized protein n=1 Tax=Cucumis melo TaxID=3656 RepID=A0A9I9DCW8_CUCME